MKSKFNIVEGFVPATPRSQRNKNAAAGGGSTVVVEGSGGDSSVTDPNSHTHTNLALLESLAVQDGYLTRKEENPDTGENADPVVYTKFKAGFADKAGDSEKWNGNAFADYLNQPVRKEDAVEHKSVTVSERVTSKDFRQGDFSGSGFGLYQDANGNAVAEVDILKARKEAVFNTAIINQVTFKIGATVFSNGGCEIARVEELDDVYRCYYDTKEGRRLCGLVAYDQVRCQRYDPSQHTIVKYYWRLVMSVGDDYVDLSKTFVDGSGIPEVGDEIAQFGNRTDKTRQSATIIDPQDGSSVVVYSQLDSFSLSKKNYVGMGTNPQTGRAYLFCYGDFFLGDRELKDQFLTFQIPEGQTVPQLFAKMNVSLGSGSSGLTNLTEWPDKQQQIDDAAKNAQTAKTAAEDAKKLAQAVEKELGIIQSDGYVSAVEKPSLKLRQADMQAEYPQIVAEAEKYGFTNISGNWEVTPEYWEQGTSSPSSARNSWESSKSDSRYAIRLQKLLHGSLGCTFSVASGYRVMAVSFNSQKLYISNTGFAQTVSVTNESVSYIGLVIDKGGTTAFAPENIANAGLMVTTTGGGTSDISDASNWEGGMVGASDFDIGTPYDETKWSDGSTVYLRTKNAIPNPGGMLTIEAPYEIVVYYYDDNKLYVKDFSPFSREITLKDYPYLGISLRYYDYDNKEFVDVSPDDITDSGISFSEGGGGNSGGGDVYPTVNPSDPLLVAFTEAYKAANNALTKYTATTPENIPIEADYADIAAYYPARQIILDAIAEAVKAHFDTLSDYEYLKEVFPNMVTSSNGAFLSRLMAVKDSAEADAEVVAGMYGGGVEELNNDGFKDQTHGTLMFFAGATDLRGVAQALFRVYGDGFFACENAEVSGVIRARTMYTPFVQPTIIQGMVIDPFVYGCNMLITNAISSGISYVSLPNGAQYNGMVVRLCEPFFTRSNAQTEIRGSFMTPNDVVVYNKITPNMNSVIELTNVGGSRWILANPEQCKIE